MLAARTAVSSHPVGSGGGSGNGMVGGVQVQEVLDLQWGQRLHAHLAQVEIILDAQGFAVIEAAAGENGAVSGR